MLLREVQKILDAEVLVGTEKLDLEVYTAFGAGMNAKGVSLCWTRGMSEAKLAISR